MTSSERIRLAQELHDGIAQDLVGIGYQLDLLVGDLETTPESKKQLRKLRFDIDDVITRVRREMFELRASATPSISEGLVQLIKENCPGLTTSLELAEIQLPPQAHQQVLKIAKEIFRNIYAHSHASFISISLKHADSVAELEIADNGIGGPMHKSERFGLLGARERASDIGGTLGWITDNGGTKVLLRIPTFASDRSDDGHG